MIERHLNITNLPVELVHHILELCHPWDVATFSKAGRAAHALVYLVEDQYLWRRLFHNYGFDYPHVSPLSKVSKKDIDWRCELKARMKTELDLLRGPVTSNERIEAFNTLLVIIEDSALAFFHRGSSKNAMWLRRILKVSLLLHHVYSVDTVTSTEGDPSRDSLYTQLYPRMRTNLALSLDPKRDRETMQLILDTRNDSRAFVYDLRNYTKQNDWGPFMPDGSVNWIHIEHLVKVIWTNIRELPGSWALTRPPSCIDAPRVLTVAGSSSEDWAGVEGTWRRYVSFMDYRDLFAFNYSDLADGPYNPQFFADPRFREATRLIEVKLSVVPQSQLRFRAHLAWKGPRKDASLLEPPAATSSSTTGPSVMEEAMLSYPPIFFSGVSKGVSGNESTVEGCVVMGKDKVPRWSFTSVYEGHPQWSSKGVQIGGTRSAMGVVGVWTSTAHDADDPAGPFWLWKVEAGSPSHLMEYT